MSEGAFAAWPSISAIVPTRQRPKQLRRAVTSILAQRYEGDVEAIVIFDGEEPTDPGVPVGEGRQIRLLRNDRAPGLAGARNTGILAASGGLIAHCDDDDEWLPEKLRKQVERLRMSAEAEVAVTGVTVVYENRAIDRVLDSPTVVFEQLLRSRLQEIHPSSILARRDALLDGIGLVDEALPGSYAEDYDWLLRASRRVPIAVVREPLVRAYWHRSSYFADRWATIAEALQYLLEKFPEFRSDRRGLARLYGQLAFANAAIGNTTEARAWAGRAIRLDPRERRAYLALGVSTGLVSAEAVLRLAHKFGRGI